MSAPLRLRYAPSPTGDLHLGSLRTVIFDYLLARQAEGGSFIVRIEDTDQARTVPGAVKRQLEGLRWMGLEPDEGVCLDEKGEVTEKGSFGPYTQSARLEIYHEHAERLLAGGQAYRCFCSTERLQEMRAEQEKNHQPPRYDRRCRSLSREESDSRAAAGEPFVIRQAMPDGREIKAEDVVRGSVAFQSSELDDQVLLKSDGFPTYHLASVVDDHLMEITLVTRGEEWLPSLPKNLLLYEAFGWQPPRFAHLPVILGPDGKHKLSKRDGDVSILDYRDRGFLPEALLNTLVLVGWSPGSEEEFFTKEELVERFRLEKVQKAPAVFSFERLDHISGWYVRRLPVEEVVKRMLPFVLAAGLVERLDNDSYWPEHELRLDIPFQEYLKQVAASVQERLRHFDESVELSSFFFKRPDVAPELLHLIVPKKRTPEETKTVYLEAVDELESISARDWEHDELKDRLLAFIAKKEYKNGDVLWPLRAALTGQPASPGAFEMLALLGRTESLIRLHEVGEVL